MQVDDLYYYLTDRNVPCVSIHGDKEQHQRQTALRSFLDGKSRVMIATDVAARGLDFPKISYVINLEIPRNIEDYVHRVGRTGRAGQKGTAITFVKSNEGLIVNDLRKILQQQKQKIPGWFDQVCSDAKEISQQNKRGKSGNRFNGNNSGSNSHPRNENFGNSFGIRPTSNEGRRNFFNEVDKPSRNTKKKFFDESDGENESTVLKRGGKTSFFDDDDDDIQNKNQKL